MAKEKKEKKEQKPQKLNLHQKLIEIRKQVTYLKKGEKSFNYNYAKGSVLLGLLRPKMDELNVLLSYEIEEMDTSDVERTQFDKKTKENINVQLGRVRMKYTFIFTDADDPKQEMKRTLYFQGVGDDIKDIGGYNTYAIRYFLLGFFNIPTDDMDPDSFENTTNLLKPKELISKEQEKNINDLINGHSDIRRRIIAKYNAISKIAACQYDQIITYIQQLIQEKEATND